MTNNNRVFIGIDISYRLKNIIKMVSTTLESNYNDIKWVTGNSLHITISFLGNINKKHIAEISNKIRESFLVEQFKISVEGTGLFPNQLSPKVFWLDIGRGREDLEVLHNRIENIVMPYKEINKKEFYIPHITIGRLKSNVKPRKIDTTFFLNALYSPCIIDVNSVQLYESKLDSFGANYTVLEKITLDKER